MRLWRDDIVYKDMDWIRSIHPTTLTLEQWMRQTGYQGALNPHLLKVHENGEGATKPPGQEILSKL